MVPFAGVELLEAGGGMAITSVSDNTNILVRALMVIMHLWSQGKANTNEIIARVRTVVLC